MHRYNIFKPSDLLLHVADMDRIRKGGIWKRDDYNDDAKQKFDGKPVEDTKARFVKRKSCTNVDDNAS